MKIEILEYKDLGDKERERVVLNVKEDTDVGTYIISTTTVNPDNSISASISNIYWLPNQKVKAGDWVIIYTKGGTKKKLDNEDGSSSYFYYWNLPNTLLSLENSTVVLFETIWNNKAIVKVAKKADEYI